VQVDADLMAELKDAGIVPLRLWGTQRYALDEINAALAEACLDRGVAFVDVFSRVSDASGGLRQDLTVDGLHLSGAAVAQLRAAAAAAGVL